MGEVSAIRLTVGVNRELDDCERNNGNALIVTIMEEGAPSGGAVGGAD